MTKHDGIVPALAQALEKHGYTELTAVQKAVLDSEIGEADALVSAQTGSGKTVAFGLALAPTLLGGEQRFSPASTPLALAIAPTRELALQVARELEWLYEFAGATIATCVGGMDMRTERRALDRGAHIVVGTPGRLRDHITRLSLDVAGLKAIVLDEADEMLDLGFREDLEFILDAAPAERRTLMFSATVPRAIATLAEGYQRDAVRVTTAGEEKQHHDIEYRALSVAPADRENAIINVLRYYEARNALVFCNTRAAVNHLTARFNNRNFSVVALSGELSQNERSHALQAMRDGRARVCIATDVAARGIDLPNLELVIHADLPSNPETLLHRSGRTGRAGRKGVSALIIPYSARRRTERLLHNAGITPEWANPPSADAVLQRDNERMLADPAFTQPVADSERAVVDTLLDAYSAEQVAVAFLRLSRAGRSAPEELGGTRAAQAFHRKRRKARFAQRKARPARGFRRQRVVLAVSGPPAERRATLADPDAVPHRRYHQARNRRHQDAAAGELRADRGRQRRPVFRRAWSGSQGTGQRHGQAAGGPTGFVAGRLQPADARQEAASRQGQFREGQFRQGSPQAHFRQARETGIRRRHKAMGGKAGQAEIRQIAPAEGRKEEARIDLGSENRGPSGLRRASRQPCGAGRG
jgi:ATP-dependent RNA helicase DeaD